jgi:two-component system, LytTR family, response regulator
MHSGSNFSLKAVVAFDESNASENLHQLLEERGSIRIVAECSEVGQIAGAIALQRPDLLFLDLDMAGAFDLLRTWSSQVSPAVIAVAAGADYAAEAFDTCAVDYLVKPFSPERLHRALERAAAERTSKTNPARPDGRLIIKCEGRIVFVRLDEIDWIEAEGNYVRIYVGGQSAYLSREGISGIASRLNPQQFIRIHRSFLVNAVRIKELQPCNNGELMVLLRNGKQLPCSRIFRPALDLLWKSPGHEHNASRRVPTFERGTAIS